MAHSRRVIFVSLRMAASAEAPLSLISLSPRLWGDRVGTVREQACQWALTERKTLSWVRDCAAYFRLVICVWLSTSASLAAACGPMLLL